MHIVKLHATDFFKLFLYASAPFKGVLQNLRYIIALKLAVRFTAALRIF